MTVHVPDRFKAANAFWIWWLSNHTTKRRKLSDVQRQNPMVLATRAGVLSV
jgi:hypothetical protein